MTDLEPGGAERPADTFPEHWRADVLASDGGVVHLRPVTPEDGVAWLRLGISLVQLGKGAAAVPPLQKAQKLGVQPSLVQYQMAQALALSGSPRDALGILQSLAEEDFYPVTGPAAQEKAFASLARDPVFQKVSAAM